MKNNILFFLFSFGITFWLMVFLNLSVAQTTSQLMRVVAGTTQQISAHGVCWKVTNTGTTDIMVPYASAVEWSAFIMHRPSQIVLSACCTPNCTGKVCGDNGCGGVCGTCSSGKTCHNGTCSSICLVQPLCSLPYWNCSESGGYCHAVQGGVNDKTGSYCRPPAIKQACQCDCPEGWTYYAVGSADRWWCGPKSGDLDWRMGCKILKSNLE